MKTRLLKLIIIFFSIALSAIYTKAFAQTVTLTGANSTTTNGITAGSIADGQKDVVLYGFTVQVSGSLTFNQINLNGNAGGLFTNGRLYRSAANSTSFSTAQLISNNFTFSGSNPVISGLSETIANTNYTYFLVADLTKSYGTIPGTVQFSFSQIVRNSPYNTYTSITSGAGVNFSLVNPTFTLTGANAAANGITQGTLIAPQSNVVLFGFSVSCNVSATISTINLNSSSSQSYLSSYFSGGTLYKSSSNTFASATPVSGATVTFSGYQHTPGVTISGLSEQISSTPVYYFIKANFDQTSGTLPASVQLKFETTQSNAFITSNSTNISGPANISGTNFSLSNPIVTLTDANAASNGITQGTLTPGASNLVLFGFGVSVTGSSKISEFHVYNTYSASPASAYLNNGKIYRSTSSTFSFATATQITAASVSFGYDAASGISVTGLTETISNNATPIYYFIVGDFNTGFYGTLPSTTQFRFLTSQTNPVVQSSPSTANIPISTNINGATFSLSYPTVAVTGYNSASNGITSGALSYGQTGIVLFGFKMDVSGLLYVNQLDIPSTINTNAYFTNGKIYRSTDQYFSNATVRSGTVTFGGSTVISGMADTLNSNAGTGSYYYFLVADFTASTSYTAPNTLKYNFSSGTNFLTQSSPYYRQFSNASTTNGNLFTIAATYNWVGSSSTSFIDAGNYRTLSGNAGSVPGTNDVVQIGVAGYQYPYYQPTVSASKIIKGLVFGTNNTPTLTIASGQTLTLSDGITINASGSPIIAGPGGVSTTGTSTMAPTSTLTLNSNATLNNTGTFTLRSDSTGSATIGKLTGTAKFTGNFNVERFIKGWNAKYRSYRLLSSPVNISDKTDGTGNINLGYIGDTINVNKKGAMTGGTGTGFTVTSTSPSIYLYDERAASRNKGINKIYATGNVDIAGGTTSTTTLTNQYIPVGNGYLFFFSGDTQAANIPKNKITTGVPQSVAITSKGYLNQGDVTVTLWTSQQSGGPAAGKLSYANASATGMGYNLVGNPYPSAISLSAFYTTNSGSIEKNIYMLYPDKTGGQPYYAYNAQTGQTSVPPSTTTAAPTNTVTDSIATGQGFIVRASAANKALTFKEIHKISKQPVGTRLFMGLPKQENALSSFFMKLEQDDQIADYCGIYFINGKSDDYDEDDAIDMDAASPKVYMSSYTADNRRTAINTFGDYSKGKTVKLYANATTDGLFKIKIENITNIDTVYDIWLKDKLMNDSLDMRHNRVYTFRITRSDATTWGANRFELVIRRKPLPPYQLISFTGEKAQQEILVKWKAYNEANYTGFVLEKLDANKQYAPIYQLQSNGSTNYNFVDKNPSTGANTYRLRQDDIDNKVSYTEPVTVDYNTNLTNNPIAIYPNPTPDIINVNMAAIGTVTGNSKMLVYNTSGRLVLQKEFSGATLSQNVTGLVQGTYVVEVTDSKGKVVGRTKFVKY